MNLIYEFHSLEISVIQWSQLLITVIVGGAAGTVQTKLNS